MARTACQANQALLALVVRKAILASAASPVIAGHKASAVLRAASVSEERKATPAWTARVES
jgi:hypothetical protein